MTADQKRHPTWWGHYDYAEGETRIWRIKPLTLAIYRAPNEWRVAYQWDEADDEEGWDCQTGVDFPETYENTERFVFQKTAPGLWLRPALPDREVMTSPRIPLHVPPGEEARLLVGVPLWVRLETEDPVQTIREIPARRLSDTWFGSIQEGELCYASRTRAVLDLTSLTVLYRRAVTPILIRNQMNRVFTVDKLKLPVRFLSLYADASGIIWTEGLTATQPESEEPAEVTINKGAPEAARQAKVVTEPREAPQPGILIRLFGSLFGTEPWEGGRP